MPRKDAERKTLNAKRTHQYSPGFSLVEILLSVFLILAILSVVLVAAGTYLHSRTTSLESTATGIASRDIENQRKAGFASVSTNSITDSELSKLPNATATRTVSTYDGNNNMKKVADIIGWTEKGATRQIILETLISANGL